MNRMSIEEFGERLLESITLEFNKHGSYDCRLDQTQKNNVTQKTLVIRKEGSSTAPAFYLDDIYRKYLKGKTVHQISQELVHFYNEIPLPVFDGNDFSEFKKVKKQLRVRLVGKENNESFYKQGPHRCQTLGVEVLYLELENAQREQMYSRVTYGMADRWKVPEQELFQAAFENVQEQDKIIFCSLDDFVRKMSSGAEKGGKSDFYILTNERLWYGATVASYPGVLKQVREELGEDYYILPSSTHEVLVIPKTACTDEKELRDLLRDTNRNMVDPEEVLGNDLYEFQGSTNKVRKCVKEERER